MSFVSDDKPVDPDRLAGLETRNLAKWLLINWLGNHRLPETLDFVRHGVVGVVRENQKHTIFLPAPHFGVGEPLGKRQLEKSSSSVKSLPKQREKVFSRMPPCSQSLVKLS